MSKQKSDGTIAVCVIKGVVVGLVVSLMLTLIIALLTTFTEISDTVIMPIQSVSKQLSVIIGAFVAVNKNNRGWSTGLFTGIFFSMCAFIIYSLIGGEFVFDRILGLDILFSSVTGTISGIIAVNIKK